MIPRVFTRVNLTPKSSDTASSRSSEFGDSFGAHAVDSQLVWRRERVRKLAMGRWTNAVFATVLAALVVRFGNVMATPVSPGGTVVRWGQTSMPRDWSGYGALAEGIGGNGIGVRFDGTLAQLGWDGSVFGWEVYPELNSLTEVVDAVSGSSGGVALLRDGRIHPWGTYAPPEEGRFYRQFGPVTKVVALAVSMNHAVVLRSDGTALCGGENLFYQCSPPQSATNLVQVAAGNSLSIGLRADGTLVSWGAGFYGSQDFPPGFSNVVEIAASQWNTFARLRDGRVRIFGDDIPGGRFWPGVTNAVALAAGSESAYAILADRTVRSWGRWPAPEWLHGVRTLLPGVFGASAQVDVPVIANEAGDPVEGVLALAGNSSIKLKALYSSGPGIEFRWRRNGQEIPGQTGSELVVTGTSPGDAGTYSVSVPTLEEDRLSQDVRIVFGTPVIVSHPASYRGPAGTNLVLRAEVVAGDPIRYDWWVDGEPLEIWNTRTGAFLKVPSTSDPELHLDGVQPSMSGRYQLVASTDFGTVVSAEALVQVTGTVQDAAAQARAGSEQSLRSGGGIRELGQTFVASVSGGLDRVRLAGCAEPLGEFPTTLELRDVAEDRPGSRVLCRMERANLGCGAIEFVPAEEVFLEADQTYALVIANGAPANPPRLCRFDSSTDDVYPSGQLWTRAGPETPWALATGTAPGTVDLVFAVRVTPGLPPLRIVGVSPGARVPLGQPVELEVIAAQDLPFLDPVELFAGTKRIGTLNNPPYLFQWTPDSPGAVELRAVAANPVGGVQSMPVQIQVRGPGPDNDDYVKARPLSGERVRDDFWLTGATREAFEPEMVIGAQGQSAWWSWTAPRSGILRIQVDAGFTAPVALFEGTRFPGAELRVSGWGSCELPVEEGRPYRIGVDAPSLGSWVGTLRLMLYDFLIESPKPGTILLPSQSITFKTGPLGERPLKELALWSDGVLVQRWSAEPFTMPASVLSPGSHRIWLEARDVDGRETESPEMVLTVRPPNDFFQNAAVVVGNRIEVEATNEGCEGINPGSPYPRDPRYGDNQGKRSLWYRWSAPRGGRVRLRGEGLPGGVMLGAYLPGTAGSLVQVTVNAFMPAGDPADFIAEPGQTYFIMVDGLFQG